MENRIEQLLHGYGRGHERLAGSVKLDPRDADLVGRLSDLSGTLSGEADFQPYLTAYPLPSGTHYAVAQTWPDRGAPRSGCVMTHTLLVPMSAWEQLREPSALVSLLRFPERRVADPGYDSPLPLHDSTSHVAPTPGDPLAAPILDFVQRFFGDGTKPIVWFGRKQPSELVWPLLRGLWPKARARFSACTLCFQPRTLEDRPFDLMFAPAEAYPRFAKLGDSHFIDDSMTSSRLQAPVEDWCRDWAKSLFASSESVHAWTDLWGELDDEPTAIRKLFLIQAMAKTASMAPQAAVGKMDLLESVAREPGAGLERKRRTAEAAAHFALVAPDAADGLESLRLIEDRLRRPAYAEVAAAVGPELQSAVSAVVGRHPELASRAMGSAMGLGDLNDSWFGRGVLDGLVSISTIRPDEILVLNELPLDVVRTLANREEVFAAYSRALLSHRDDVAIRNRLVRWLDELRDMDSRRRMRRIAREALPPSDVELVSLTLKGLPEDEVGDTLDWLMNQKGANGRTDRICEHISQEYPAAVRSWAHGMDRWDEQIATVVSATVPKSRSGLRELLMGEDFPPERLPLLVAAYLRTIWSDRFPHWLGEYARESPVLLKTLLRGASEGQPIVSWSIDRLLAAAPEIPVTDVAGVATAIEHSRGQPHFARLVDGLMRGLIVGYISDDLDESAAQAIWATHDANSWLEAVDPFELKAVVTRHVRTNVRQWVRAWRWIASAPTSLYSRRAVVLPDLIDALLRAQSLEWPAETTDHWVRILRRCRVDGCSRRTQLLLSVQSLDFAFRNGRLPLSRLVVESFLPVYVAVTTSSSLPPETATMFGILDWDKGKELRRDLIDAFFYTQWPPGDLALATGDVGLLRKVFKRLLRKSGGQQYARAMYADLSSRMSADIRPFVSALADMLHDPGFYEEWD